MILLSGERVFVVLWEYCPWSRLPKGACSIQYLHVEILKVLQQILVKMKKNETSWGWKGPRNESESLGSESYLVPVSDRIPSFITGANDIYMKATTSSWGTSCGRILLDRSKQVRIPILPSFNIPPNRIWIMYGQCRHPGSKSS